MCLSVCVMRMCERQKKMNLRSKLEELDVSRRVSTDLLMRTLSALFTCFLFARQ